MKPRILVTGVGGGVGQSIIKALQNTPYTVIGADSEPLAAGLYGTDRAYRIPYAADAEYVNSLLGICIHESCSLILPGHDVELIPLAASTSRFRGVSAIPVVSDLHVLQICDDKRQTADFLRSNGLAAPWTLSYSDAQPPDYPFVLKPQVGGARSRKVYVIRNAEELDTFRRLIDPANCIIQEYINGDEYTCGTINFGGKCQGVIAMRRILRAGDTYKAFVERDRKVEEYTVAVMEALKPFGACNLQLKLRDGEPVAFEINARCSGTTAARALAGFNEPKMVADFILQGAKPSYEIRPMTILRYWSELTVENERIAELSESGFVAGNGVTLR